MDCGSLLTFGTQRKIRSATLACLEAGSGGGGHIFCASNAITASVPLANYLAMVNAYRDAFGLPRLTI
jgi:uroporphyrinogen-III decarboxylase